ncbi:hypothetical protein BHE90_016119 [Fusarium euwallaceae]|uniref:Uncharacterized protein n=1 Tax=Fusarium euwallaceae TaxID=1147111 RepID=A0A430L1E0_9HYPO|nr:hypothetical protein BHE90_016119 [Fusarium euwallaceae]
MPEDELYAQLVGLREQMSIGPTQGHSLAPMLELDNSPERSHFPQKWCQNRQMKVAKTFEECDEVNECIWFLRKGLTTYESLKIHRPNRRKRRRTRTAVQLDSDSEPISGSDDEAEGTSDEESLGAIRSKQALAVRKMEARVRELIGEFQQRYRQWQKSYNSEMRGLEYRLERVE